MDKVKYGKQLLCHYINLASERSEAINDYECRQEIESIVDLIVEATVEQAVAKLERRISDNEDRIQKLFARGG